MRAGKRLTTRTTKVSDSPRMVKAGQSEPAAESRTSRSGKFAAAIPARVSSAWGPFLRESGRHIARCNRSAQFGPHALRKVGRISARPKTGDLMKRHQPNDRRLPWTGRDHRAESTTKNRRKALDPPQLHSRHSSAAAATLGNPCVPTVCCSAWFAPVRRHSLSGIALFAFLPISTTSIVQLCLRRAP